MVGCSSFGTAAEVQPHSRRRQALQERMRLQIEGDDWTARPQEPPRLEEEALVVPPAVPEIPLSPSGAPTLGEVANQGVTPAPGEATGKLDSLAANAGDDAESVAHLIGPTTPPSVAAALRCIERGRALFAAGQVAAAREWFERALGLDGNNVYAYYFLARAAIQSSRYDQAQAFVARAVTLSGQAPDPWRSRILALQGQVLEAVGRFPEARQAYRQAAQIDPTNAGARAGLARLSAAP